MRKNDQDCIDNLGTNTATRVAACTGRGAFGLRLRPGGRPPSRRHTLAALYKSPVRAPTNTGTLQRGLLRRKFRRQHRVTGQNSEGACYGLYALARTECPKDNRIASHPCGGTEGHCLRLAAECSDPLRLMCAPVSVPPPCTCHLLYAASPPPPSARLDGGNARLA
eukprot:3067116-Prymnesium_polylepis.1